MIELHPYGEFIPSHPRFMIIGSFPIGKFTNPKKRSQIKPHEIDFFFGGEKNLLWKLLGQCFEIELKTKSDIVNFLETQGIAVGDLIRACRRKKGSASDSALFKIEWNKNLLGQIQRHQIQKVFFTSRQVERWFNRLFPEARGFEQVTLISPSAQTMRSLSRWPGFKVWEREHPCEEKFNFILADYRFKFRTIG